MNGLPYYKAYPRDFIEGTIGMSFELKAAYRLVLDLIYMQGGNLPDDARYISGLLGCTMRKWNVLRDELVSIGKIEITGEFLTNKRAVIELETLAKLQEKQSERASTPRKNKDLQKPRLSQPEPDTDNTSSLRSDVKAQAPAKAKRGSRLPDDFMADISEAVRLGLSEQDAHHEADKFRDYWNSQPGQRGVKLDWLATWRNWCRSAVERKPHRKEPPPKPSTPRNAGEAAYLELQRNGTDDISPEFKQLLFGSDTGRDRREPDTAEIITLESKRYGGF
ncbi:DUF1376 domain-containing protein [Brucella pituitosa]|nr:DUF1376 domain-containing protein [Brucella pituitosa]